MVPWANFKLEKYWEPPEVKKEDFMEKDESGKLIVNELKKTAIIQAVKDSRTTYISKLEHNRESMYAYIMSKLGKESKNEVKRHGKYDSFSVTNDPLELWMTIKELHSSVATGSKVKGVIKRKAWE